MTTKIELPEGVKLLVDNSEPEQMLKRLDRLGVPFVRKELTTGDYIPVLKDETPLGLVFERKAISDYFGSLHSGRLFSQAERLKQFPKPFVIIVGSKASMFFASRGKGIQGKFVPHANTNAFLGSRARLIASGINIEHVDNDTQFIYLISKITEKMMMPSTGFAAPQVLDRKTPESIPALLLSCLPDVGFRTAQKILEAYDVRLMLKRKGSEVCASADELSGIEGFGVKTAEKVKPYFYV